MTGRCFQMYHCGNSEDAPFIRAYERRRLRLEETGRMSYRLISLFPDI